MKREKKRRRNGVAVEADLREGLKKICLTGEGVRDSLEAMPQYRNEKRCGKRKEP